MAHRPNRTDEFFLGQEPRRWTAPLPIARRTVVPWILCDGEIITTFERRGQRRALNYEQQIQVDEMQDRISRFRDEGRLPPAEATWIWPDDARAPEAVVLQSHRWLEQKQAHFISLRAAAR